MIWHVKPDVRNEINWIQGSQRAFGNLSKALLWSEEGLAPYLIPISRIIDRLTNDGRFSMSVILINPFEVPEGKEEEALAFWEEVADYMRKQPGFISTQLHRAIVPWARFQLVNVAEWSSVAHFEAAINSEEFKKLTDPYMDIFPHYPGLYEVVKT